MSFAADMEALIDDAAFGTFGEPVTVDGAAATAICEPEDASAPGTELARRSVPVLKLAFRDTTPNLRRGARVVFRSRAYVIDGVPDVADALIVVSLLPETP